MNAADLKVFEAVARLGAMNRAAAEPNTVQSNVSARVRRLEQALAAPLFDRRSSGVVLTAAGRRLLPYAVKVARLLDEAARAVADDGRPAGALTIGSLETTAALRLSPVLSAYASAHPGVDLVLRTGTTAELIEQVLGHRLEGAFICGPVDHPQLLSGGRLHGGARRRHRADRRRDRRAREDGGAQDRGPARRSLLPPTPRRDSGAARSRRSAPARIRHPRLDHRLRGGRPRRDAAAHERPRPARREGRVAVHELPAAEARVETLFIRRRDAYASSALEAFLQFARPGHALDEIVARVATA